MIDAYAFRFSRVRDLVLPDCSIYNDLEIGYDNDHGYINNKLTLGYGSLCNMNGLRSLTYNRLCFGYKPRNSSTS